MEIRHAVHPDQAVVLDTAELREHFLIQDLFIPDEAKMVYTYYDRKSEVEKPQS
jgi:4-deoxy-L-threo-5-hexosulose-uronate ketol-isomerase